MHWLPVGFDTETMTRIVSPGPYVGRSMAAEDDRDWLSQVRSSAGTVVVVAGGA